MPDFLYRFRSLDRLLAKGELEKQEIFFAAPSTLNDPVEGYLDIFWQGDSVVWENLFKHYLLCLFTLHLVEAGTGKKSQILPDDFSIFLTPDRLATDQLKSKYHKICESFLKNKSVVKLIANLESNNSKVRADELMFYLKCLHPLSLSLISSNLGYGFDLKAKKTEEIININLGKLEEFPVEVRTSSKYEEEFENGKISEYYTELIRTLNNPAFLTDNRGRFLGFEFCQIYIKRIQEMMFPEWYAACFLLSAEDASLWGHYGENHRGVCLKFKVKDGANGPFMNLKCLTSWSATRGKEIQKNFTFRPFIFKEVTYDRKYPEINFFRSLGRLSAPVLQKYWYRNTKGDRSPCGDWISNQSSESIEELWRPFHESINTKLFEWRHEQEWRLSWNGLLDQTILETDRHTTFDFSDLEGIIFGINTPLEFKYEISKIVRRKCLENKRSEFNFSQAYYSHIVGKIKVAPLPPFNFGAEI